MIKFAFVSMAFLFAFHASAETVFQLCKIQGSTRWHLVKSNSSVLAAKIVTAKLSLANSLAVLHADQTDRVTPGQIADNENEMSQEKLPVACSAITEFEARDIQKKFSSSDAGISLFDDLDLIHALEITR